MVAMLLERPGADGGVSGNAAHRQNQQIGREQEKQELAQLDGGDPEAATTSTRVGGPTPLRSFPGFALHLAV